MKYRPINVCLVARGIIYYRTIMAEILVVDDEETMRVTLERALSLQGHRVVSVRGGVEGLEELLANKPNLVLLDLMLNDTHFNGIELLGRIRQLYPKLPVIMMSGYGTVDRAVRAMHLGADEFIRKPFSIEEINAAINRVEKRIALQENARIKHSESIWPEAVMAFVSEDPTLRTILQRVQSIGRDRWNNALIVGEVGCGKTALARLLHGADGPHDRTLISVDCARIQTTADLENVFGVDSEANSSLCQLAAGGSMLFEEIACLTAEGQHYLLDFIEHRREMGSGGLEGLDVRVIATSRTALSPLGEGGQIEDRLFQLLGMNSLYIPPLRERRGDIELLCRSFWSAFAGSDANPSLTGVLDRLPTEYSWPGNVRELKNWTERRWIEALTATGERGSEDENISALHAHELMERTEPGRGFDQVLRLVLLAAIERCRGNLEAAQRYLGLGDSEFRDYLRRTGLAEVEGDS